MVKTYDQTLSLKSMKKKLLVCSKFSKCGSVGKIGHNGMGLNDSGGFRSNPLSIYRYTSLDALTFDLALSPPFRFSPCYIPVFLFPFCEWGKKRWLCGSFKNFGSWADLCGF